MLGWRVVGDSSIRSKGVISFIGGCLGGGLEGQLQ